MVNCKIMRNPNVIFNPIQDLSGRLAEVQSGQLSTESLHYQQLSDLQEINSGLQRVSHALRYREQPCHTNFLVV